MTSGVMKTLLVNPPSFEKFDGGASSRWPVSREIESYWYPVWLSFPAGMLPGSRLLDACPHKVGPEETVRIAKDYEFVVLFTSTVGFANDVKLAEQMKNERPGLKICFVGPHVETQPEQSLRASEAIDFVVRGEFDYAVVEYANGHALETIQNASFRKNGKVVHNPERPKLHSEELDALPFATEVYKRDLTIENYNVPFLKHPFVSFYSSRGCPALCTFCMWPQTLSGHAWRTRSVDSVVREFEQATKLFPQAKEFYFDDDTFNIRKDRVIEISKRLGPIGKTWSCNARVHSDYDTLKAMAEGGARLLIVGYESGDPQILKNIKKGATVEMARAFAKNCKKVGIRVHGDFIIGLPGETKETIQRTIDFAKELDPETIQVSIAHAMPGTELYTWAADKGFLAGEALADVNGHQLPHLQYPGITREDMLAGVNRFFDEYYFRPRIIWRIVREALWDADERKRLTSEATDFLKLRFQRRRMARKGIQKKDFIAASPAPFERSAPPAAD